MPPLFSNMASVSSSIALCLLGIVVLSWFSSSAPRPVTVHCQCSDSSLEPLLMVQPRNHDVPTPGVEWSELLVVSELSFCDGCAGASARFLPCGFAAWCVRHIQFGQDLTRTPLYEALRTRSSGFFAHTSSQARNDRRNYWRVTRRAVVHCVTWIRQSRRPRIPQSGPGRSAYCNIRGTSTQFPDAESTSRGVTHSWSSVVGTPPLNVLHVPFWKTAERISCRRAPSSAVSGCCFTRYLLRAELVQALFVWLENHAALCTEESSPNSSASASSTTCNSVH